MSDSQDRGYYEIALTNRQVLTAFIILLGSVLGAFFSGVWIGLEATVKEEPTQVAEATPEAGPESSGRDPEEEEAHESVPEGVDFFEGSGTAGALDEPPGSPRPSPPSPPKLAQLVPLEPGGEPQRDVTAEPEPESPQVEATAPRRERPPPAATAEAEPSEKEQEREEPRPTRSDPYVIQVFSSPDEAQARALLERLLEGGSQAFLSPVPVKGTTMYRVRVGPFPNRAQARDEAARLERRYKEIVDTWITR